MCKRWSELRRGVLCFQLSDSEDDYEFSVKFSKNSLGLGFTITSYIGHLNSGNSLINEGHHMSDLNLNLVNTLLHLNLKSCHITFQDKLKSYYSVLGNPN